MDVDNSGHKNASIESMNSLTPSSSCTEETTPRRTSPRKKLSTTPSISSMFKTPVSTPADQAKKFTLAKFRVKINTLNDEMEKAVAEKDFLKAHEIKEKIKAVEEDIKKEGGEVGASPIAAKPDSAAASPKVVPSPKTPRGRIVTVVKTPGSISPGSLKKMTPKQMAKEEEKKQKLEEREKEKQERERKKEEQKIEKEKEKQEKERLKEVERRAKEVETGEREEEGGTKDRKGKRETGEGKTK